MCTNELGRCALSLRHRRERRVLRRPLSSRPTERRSEAPTDREDVGAISGTVLHRGQRWQRRGLTRRQVQSNAIGLRMEAIQDLRHRDRPAMGRGIRGGVTSRLSGALAGVVTRFGPPTPPEVTAAVQLRTRTGSETCRTSVRFGVGSRRCIIERGTTVCGHLRHQRRRGGVGLTRTMRRGSGP